MKRRFQPEDDESVARQYAGNELYQSIRSISHLIEEKSAFAMSAEECFTEVTELLTLIASERKAILPHLETLLIEKHNEYKRLERNLSDDQIYQAVAIVFGYAMLALDSSHATFFRYTLPTRLCFTVTLRKFSGWTDLLAQIFNVDLPDGWFDRFIAESLEEKKAVVDEPPTMAYNIIPQDCRDAARDVFTDSFTVQPSGTVLNSRTQVCKAAGVVKLNSGSQLAMLKAIGVELKAVRTGVSRTDFVKALIGLRLIPFTDEDTIDRLAQGMAKKENGRGDKNAPLDPDHRKWSVANRKTGDIIYGSMKSQE